MLSGGLTGGGAGGCYGCVRNFGVSLCGNHLLRNKNFVTYGAMLAGGLAGSCAGCGNGSIGNFGVTGCGDNGSVFFYFISAAFVREILSAACAVNIIDVSVLSTGGCICSVDLF